MRQFLPELNTGSLQAGDGLLVPFRCEIICNALCDLFADTVDLLEFFSVSSGDVLDAGVAGGQQFSNFRANMKNTQGEEDAGQRTLLAGLDVGQDAGGEFIAHALQLGQLLPGQRVQIRDIED